VIALLAICLAVQTASAQAVGTLIVSVHGKDGPVAQAEVQAGSVTRMTGVDGTATLSLSPGRVDVVVTRTGFDPGATQVDIRAGVESRIDVALEPSSELEENVVVSATRSEQRIEDVPLRVEVVANDEVQEKIAMAPGDVSMLLAETNGLRVQTTSPSLGGASLRIQGLSGRYSQVLSDGLPLYGAQSGSVGILQIPPMDLQQVEVIKGVASALYGMSAIGGVVNLVSRRPKAGAPEHEVLVNRTSHRGTDAALWLARPVNDRWGYSVLAGQHWQARSDIDGDGWTDLPMFRRTQVRPRVSWDNGSGRSVFATMGALTEDRRGGTMPDATTPDGQPHPENLQTRQFDGGFVARFLTSKKVVGAIRGSGVSQRHDHAYGSAIERDRSRTFFGEASLTGTTGHNTWVGGAALQRDTFRSIDVPRFDYAYTIPGLFAQDDYAIARWLTASASVRVDMHSAFGTFFSPRLSLLFRPAGMWTARISGGRGHFAPSPFTDETEATGLTPLAPLGAIKPESANSVSADVTWRKVPFEITTTVFHSRIAGAQVFRQLPDGPFAARIVNAETPTRTNGTELIARYHTEDVDVIVTHMFLASTEVGENGIGRRQVPLNPRQSASFDLLLEMGPGRLGFEVFYTGKQTLEEDPYRSTGHPYVLWGLLYTHQLGPALMYVNTEDLADVRQTKYEPLLRPARLRDGRWSTDAWAPLDGRTLNAGLRFRF
jgi:iron complex outermembrane receptor protein